MYIYIITALMALKIIKCILKEKIQVCPPPMPTEGGQSFGQDKIWPFMSNHYLKQILKLP